MALTTLAHSPAEVIRYLLIQLGLGTDPEARPQGLWPVAAAGELTTPDETITVYDTAGTGDGRTMPDGAAHEHQGFQVRVRSRTHRGGGWAKANVVRETLARSVELTTVTFTEDGVTYRYLVRCVTGIGSVIVVGKETPTSRRSIFTLNAVVALEQQF